MSKTTGSVEINGKNILIGNPDKPLWKDLGITKGIYIEKLAFLSEYLIRHAKDRLLTTICYPDGIDGKSFYRKNIPDHAPDYISTRIRNDNEYVLLNDLETLVWLGNMAALEFHVSFEKGKENHPDALVFDLDPSEGQTFEDVAKAALLIRETLEGLNIRSHVKLSGATGLQIYIFVAGRYDYNQARLINEFFGTYFSEKYPDLFTVERNVKKRGKKLYFDYLQLWQGKTVICPYSPRATAFATVAAPLTWKELEEGARPEDFTLLNIRERLAKTGDLFEEMLYPEKAVRLDFLLEKLKPKGE
jgi:bifunctional non-homologous end joining protein LigD